MSHVQKVRWQAFAWLLTGCWVSLRLPTRYTSHTDEGQKYQDGDNAKFSDVTDPAPIDMRFWSNVRCNFEFKLYTSFWVTQQLIPWYEALLQQFTLENFSVFVFQIMPLGRFKEIETYWNVIKHISLYIILYRRMLMATPLKFVVAWTHIIISMKITELSVPLL